MNEIELLCGAKEVTSGIAPAERRKIRGKHQVWFSLGAATTGVWEMGDNTRVLSGKEQSHGACSNC